MYALASGLQPVACLVSESEIFCSNKELPAGSLNSVPSSKVSNCENE